MNLIGSPPTTAVDTQDADGLLQPPALEWRNYFVAVFNICSALTRSGTTAQRPVKYLYVGLFFYDVTLGKPIWLRSARPNVWTDASGAVV